MKLKLSLLSIFILFSIVTLKSQRELSHKATISVLTCGPGDSLYSLFGHSAVRVSDPLQEIDWVFNYGTYNFKAPNFALNFLRGKLLYDLSVSTYNSFVKGYSIEQRAVKEQILSLSITEKKNLFSALIENAKPANKKYKYDFFFDNCTTRIRDLLLRTTPDLVYPDDVYEEKTFRELLHDNLEPHPWTEFGMDLILGSITDKKTKVNDQMFLPKYYHDYLENSNKGDRSIISIENRILEFPLTIDKRSWLSPTNVFGALLLSELVFFFLYYISGHDRALFWLDNIWYLLLFVCFTIFLFMWFLTDHKVCSNNWNILWTMPWMIFVVGQRKYQKWQKFLISLTIIVAVILLVGMSWIPQYFSKAVILIVVISLVKSLRLFGLKKHMDKIIKHAAISAACLLFSFTLIAQDKIGGITLVAPPNQFTTDPMVELTQINSNWVALVPYAFNRKNSPQVIFGSNRQWWGERIEGIKSSIDLAHQNGLSIMLKPQVWIRGGWVGDMDFDNDDDWVIWENSYRKYIMTYVDIAIEKGVEMICIGTEYRISTKKRTKFWKDLISEIRNKYHGKLVYSANWDDYENVSFWKDLDYIGLSAYFPLSDFETPNKLFLSLKWKSVVKRLKRYSAKMKKPILFTEYGYLSVDGAAGKTWELEKNINTLTVNERAQANAYEALFDSFWNEDFWAGGFLWKWFPNGHGHEGYPEKDYTPQNKEAAIIIEKWYSKI